MPEATEFFDAAIEIRREPVAFERIAGEDPAIRVVEPEQVEVAGREAIRRETEATGDGMLPAGTRAQQYLVDLDGETLVAITHDLPEHDFERNREVVQEMVASLELGD